MYMCFGKSSSYTKSLTGGFVELVSHFPPLPNEAVGAAQPHLQEIDDIIGSRIGDLRFILCNLAGGVDANAEY